MTGLPPRRCPPILIVFRLWVVLAAALLFVSLPAHGGSGSWTSQGPTGGGIASLVLGGRHPALFAGLSEDVVKSVDGGRTWTRASQGLPTGSGTPGVGPFFLAVDPADPQTLYAGAREGIYKTSDAGATWRRLENDLGIRVVQKVAISPAAPRTLWVGAGNAFYVSRDAGASWSPVQGGYPVSRPDDAAVLTWEIAPDPTRANVVYASGSKGLFRTLDGGAHWTRVLAVGPFLLAIDPAHPRRIYASGVTFSGVLRSVDGGSTWRPLSNAMSTHDVRALAVDPATSAVYAAIAPERSTPQLAYRSLDGGNTWNRLGSSLPAYGPQTFVFDPQPPGRLYLGSLAGVWRSGNEGRTWVPANGGMTATYVSALAVAPSAPRIVYAGVDSAGVFQSTDRGATWSPRARGLSGAVFTALAVDPADPSTVFAGTHQGVFQSPDGGATWRQLGSLEEVNDLTLDPSDSSTLYAATAEGAFRSTDGGESWSLVWSAGPGVESSVYQLAVSPAHPWEVYFTRPSGLFASSDRGDTWTQLPFPAGAAYRVAVDPLHPSILYVGGDGALRKSTDGGLTWVAADAGLPSATPASITIDPVHPDTLYCANWFGVFWSTDGAATWSRLGGPLGSPALSLALDPSGPTTVHAGTLSNGAAELTRIVRPPPR